MFIEDTIFECEKDIEYYESLIDKIDDYHAKIRDLEYTIFDNEEEIESVVADIREIEDRLDEIALTEGVKYSYKELEDLGQMRLDYIGSELLSV